jgi:transcriptional regulator with XRE-family HTH domain
MNSVIENVACNLRRLRAERGVTLAGLTRASGVARATVTNLEAGRGNPTVETLFALADALGVSFGELVSEPERAAVEVIRADEGGYVAGAIQARMLGRVYGHGLAEILEIVCTSERRRQAAPHPPGVV